ncbi:MAG: cysteine desulfurase NifS [Oscillospiraceae bacterium]|nr:cysteine desulfurase NifS [Oscillospiraceae bacterium]
MEQKIIYADNAATTPVSPSVLEKMLPFFSQSYGNPSSMYSIARDNKEAVEHARAQIASAINADPNEIYFTAGGSESDNWAIKGIAQTQSARGKKHLITTNFEHHAVLHTMEELEKAGFEVTYLPVNEDGLVTAEQVAAALRPETALVSIMYANNEIGTIQPIAEIGELCRQKGVMFHTDAVQAVGAIPIDVKAEKIDLLSMSSHKFNGPKGVGALYIRKGIRPARLIHGGGQERGQRAGTENVPGIVGMGQALENAIETMESKTAHLLEIRDYVVEAIEREIPRVRLNGHRTQRLPGNVNVSFQACEGESLLLFLDMAGICASSGSACTSGSLDPSHVLLAIGLPHELAHGSIRLTFGGQNTLEEARHICEELKKIVAEVRRRSPLWNEEKGA